MLSLSFCIKTKVKNSAPAVFGVLLLWQKTSFFQELRIHNCGEVMTGRQTRRLMSCIVASWTTLYVNGVPLPLEVRRF